jgi:hypothetical protein
MTSTMRSGPRRWNASNGVIRSTKSATAQAYAGGCHARCRYGNVRLGLVGGCARPGRALDSDRRRHQSRDWRLPSEVFLIEGHTDAVGSDVDNLSLSDHRAESVALVLSEQFGVPAENLTTQGYGEQYLKVPTQGPERANRRVTVRRIKPLLTGQNEAVPLR